jgi:inorganic pyrophosphatase
MSKKNGLADPTRLKPFDSDDKQMLRVVIETPKGSRNKFAFDPEEHIFELKKVLPAGMTFPYDFGFVPSTKADDGDPVDVLVLMANYNMNGVVVCVRGSVDILWSCFGFVLTASRPWQFENRARSK